MPESKGKATVVANVQAVKAYADAASALGEQRERQARGLVGKYGTALRRGRLSVAVLAASLKEAQASLAENGMRDPLGWRPSWSALVLTVDALMQAPGSSEMPLDALFALADDMQCMMVEGKRQGAEAARAQAASGASVQDIRQATPKKAAAKRKPRPPKGPEAVASPADVLEAALESLEARCAEGAVPEALALAIEDAIVRLSALMDSATVR